MPPRSVAAHRVWLVVLIAACSTAPRPTPAPEPAAGAAPRAAGIAGTPGEAFFAFQVDQQATISSSAPPTYPAMLLSGRVAGTVLAQFVVGPDSLPDMRTFKVLRSDQALFTQAVRDALPRFRFVPARKGGREVRQLVQMPFNFSLSDTLVASAGRDTLIRMRRAYRGGSIVVPPGDSAALAAFALELPLPRDSGECMVVPAPDGGRIVMIQFPSAAEGRSSATVWLDSLGRFVRYNDLRRSVPMPNAPLLTKAAVDSAMRAAEATRSSRVVIEYRQDRAFLMNRGGGSPPKALSVPLAMVAHDPRFGAPDDRAQMVVARCGSGPARPAGAAAPPS